MDQLATLEKPLPKTKRKREPSVNQESRITRLEDKLDKLADSVARLEEQGKATHSLLIKHDATGAKALEKANTLENQVIKLEELYTVPYKWLGMIAKIASGVAIAYGAGRLLGLWK